MSVVPILIPGAFREMLKQNEAWHSMLDILEKVESGYARLSKGHVETSWGAFAMKLPDDNGLAAEMMVTAAACICSHRPEFLDEFLPEIVAPLIKLDVLYPNELMDWYASREDIAPEIMQWIENELAARFNWVGDSVDGNKDLLAFAGLPYVTNIEAVAPKSLHLTNYSQVWGTTLFIVLCMIPFLALPVWAEPPAEVIGFCLFVAAMIAWAGFNFCSAMTVAVEMGDDIVVKRLLEKAIRFTPQDIRHIGLRNVRAKLYFVRTLSSHVFIDIDFFGGEEASVRVTGSELKHIMLFLAA
ncbi:MAG: hypothetical protein CO017_09975, partial [Zetaproteobacteria bacterium CG_4_8_14_3_um_filter_59_5]